MKAHQDFCTKNMNKDLFKCLKKVTATNNSNSDFPSVILYQDRKITDKLEILNLFATNFFPKAKPLQQRHKDTMDKVSMELAKPTLSFPSVSPDELQQAVFAIKSDSSPGEDGISAELLGLCYHLIADTLLCIINNCLRIGHFPTNWKRARVCIIKKPKKESYREIKSYRPISVLNTFSKVFEKLLHKRLTWLATESNWFSTRQHGFLESKSTESAAHALTHFVDTNLSRGLCTAAVFLDISGAFDSAWPPSILLELIKKDCPLYLTKLISSFLKNRTANLSSDDGTSLQHNMAIGCPQGSVLSPFLWNTLADEPIRQIFPFCHSIIAFADDLTPLAADKDPEMATANLQTMTDTIVVKTEDILIDINAIKTADLYSLESRPP